MNKCSKLFASDGVVMGRGGEGDGRGAEGGDEGLEQGGEEGVLESVVRAVTVKVKPVGLGDKGGKFLEGRRVAGEGFVGVGDHKGSVGEGGGGLIGGYKCRGRRKELGRYWGRWPRVHGRNQGRGNGGRLGWMGTDRGL